MRQVSVLVELLFVFLSAAGDPRDLPVLTHSSPQRRSAVLRQPIVLIGPDRARRDLLEGRHALDLDRQRAPQIVLVGARRAGACLVDGVGCGVRSEEHTSEPQSLMRTAYARVCLQQKMTSRHCCAVTLPSYAIPSKQH